LALAVVACAVLPLWRKDRRAQQGRPLLPPRGGERTGTMATRKKAHALTIEDVRSVVSDAIQGQNEKFGTRFDQFAARFDQSEARFDQFEARLDQFEARFDQVDQQLVDMRQDMAAMNRKFEDIALTHLREIRDLRTDVRRIDAKVDGLDARLGRVEVAIEKKVDRDEVMAMVRAGR
jgi:chromosome segregation ATPase